MQFLSRLVSLNSYFGDKLLEESFVWRARKPETGSTSSHPAEETNVPPDEPDLWLQLVGALENTPKF